MRALIPALLILGLCSLLGSGQSSGPPRAPDPWQPSAAPATGVNWDGVAFAGGPWASGGGGLKQVRGRRDDPEVQNEAFIALPAGVYADEGHPIHYRFDTPNARGPLAWKATGLPRGLSVHPATGVLSGRPQYDQAGDHPVRLTATSPKGDRHTVSFTWVVRDTNRWRWIDDQAHRVGERVAVPAGAKDEVSNDLTYTFAGLPPGISFDPKVGFVGQVKPGGEGPYEVTASVTGGNATDQQTFRWLVLAESFVGVVVGQNDTLTRRDDIIINGGPMSIRIKYFLDGSSRGPIKVEVTKGDFTLTTRAGDMVGAKSVTVHPTDWPVGWIRVFLIAKDGGTSTYTISHWVDQKWVTMELGG